MDKALSSEKSPRQKDNSASFSTQIEKKRRIAKESDSESENEITFNENKKISIEPKTEFEHPEEYSGSKSEITLSHTNYNQFILRSKKFSEVQFITEPIYYALCNCISNVFKFHAAYDAAKNDSVSNKRLSITNALRNSIDTNPINTEEEQEDGFTAFQNEESYKYLRGNRPDSELEEILSKDPELSALSTKLDPLTGVFRDPHTGLYADLVRIDRNFFVLCFPGTGAGKMTTIQWKSNIDQIRSKNTIPAAYMQAVQLASALKEQFDIKKKKFEVAGHSLGGGIANYVGLKLNICATCFNPSTLGQAVLKDLIIHGCLLIERINKQMILRIKKDLVSSKNSQLHFARLTQLSLTHSHFIPRPVGIVYLADRLDYSKNNRPPELEPLSRHQLDAFQYFYDTSIHTKDNE